MKEKNDAAIKTTGELREFLVEMMVRVKGGMLDIDRASQITKMAGQVNESFYSEIKVARIQREAGVASPPLGALAINMDVGSADK